MAPRSAKSWTLAGGAALIILAAALNIDFCAAPERPGTAAGTRERLAGEGEPVAHAPAEQRVTPAPPVRPDKSLFAVPASAPEADPAAPPAYARRDVLAAALARDFPELNLSGREMAELNATLAELEQTVRGIRGLEQGAADAGALKEFQGRRDRVLREFERIAGMSLAEFLRRAPAEGGIDTGEDDDEEIILEPLAPSQPQPVR